MKKRGLAIAVVSAMLVATLGACGSGTTKTAGDSTAAQSQDSGSKQAVNTEKSEVDNIIAQAQGMSLEELFTESETQVEERLHCRCLFHI